MGDIYMGKLLLFISFFFLSACYSVANFEKAMNNAIGTSERELVKRLGPPTKYYEVGMTKFLKYEYAYSGKMPSSYTTNYNYYTNTAHTTQYGGYSIYKYCNITFEIDNGKVSSYSYEGNDCKA